MTPPRHRVTYIKGSGVVNAVAWWKIPSGWKMCVDIEKLDYKTYGCGSWGGKREWNGVCVDAGDVVVDIEVATLRGQRLIIDKHSDQIDFYILPEKQKFIKHVKVKKNGNVFRNSEK